MSTLRVSPRGEEIGRGRVEALSDGVFAIVVTLLVLELKVPHLDSGHSLSELASALLLLLPKLTSWVISFLTVCVIWLNHHRLLALVRRLDLGLFWANVNLLLWTSFIPFPTALLGDYPENPLAASLYGAVMMAMAFAFVLMRWHLHRQPQLLDDEVDRIGFRRGTLYSLLLGPVAYAAGAALAWLEPRLAFACYGLIVLYFVLPHASHARGGGAAGGRTHPPGDRR